MRQLGFVVGSHINHHSLLLEYQTSVLPHLANGVTCSKLVYFLSTAGDV